MTVKETAAFLRQHDNYLILTHKRPDGDTIGCAAALCEGLRALGRTAWICPHTEETHLFTPYLEGRLAPEGYVPETVVSVDIAARSLFTRAGEPWLARGVDLAIDHHPSQAFFAAQTCLDAGRAACGELIYDILRELGPITPAMAIPLYVAVSTDTGCFQYSNTTADTHRVAAALMDTGIDVFTHAVEAFVSTEASDFSDAAAEKAIKLVKRHLLPAYQNPEDRKARQGMHNASCLAGIAFSNSGLGLNHGMAHALGARFHIPHGRANGILLPYVMSFNAGCAEQLTSTAKRYARISRLLELESSSVRQSALNLIRTARRYIEKLNMPSTLQAAGVNAAEFEEAVHDMAEAALADRCTATNPRSCTAEEIEQIFRKAYSGKLP